MSILQICALGTALQFPKMSTHISSPGKPIIFISIPFFFLSFSLSLSLLWSHFISPLIPTPKLAPTLANHLILLTFGIYIPHTILLLPSFALATIPATFIHVILFSNHIVTITKFRRKDLLLHDIPARPPGFDDAH